MQIVGLSEAKENEYLEDLYNCFESGYDFEKFLKLYLEEIGFDEIEVTKRTRDGGVDLIAIRKGIEDFSNIDTINYYIQAKRYKLKKVGVNAIRELKGVIPIGHKGMLITTSTFTRDSILESDNDNSRPIILVDGRALLNSCINHQIGFAFEPRFSKELFNQFNSIANYNIVNDINQEGIEKLITYNDIRAKIASVPSKIAKLLEDKKEYLFKFENDEFKSKFVKSRSYFSKGLSNMYRKYELISTDGIIKPKKALWSFHNNVITLKLI